MRKVFNGLTKDQFLQKSAKITKYLIFLFVWISFNHLKASTAPACSTAINANGTTTFCQGDSVTLTAGAGVSYIWMNGSTPVGTNSTYSAKTSGVYYVQVTNSVGCQATSSTIKVTVNALPSPPTVTNMISYCQNATASPLTATGSGLKWYTAITGGTASSTAPVPSTTKTGASNYYVSQTTNGCESSRSLIYVLVNALPVATITNTSGTTTFCQGDSIALTASSGTSYIWMNGTTQVGTAQNYNAKTSGNYKVQVTNSLGCQATSSAVSISVNPSPNAPAVTNMLTYCQNATTVPLTASGSNLLWYSTLTGGTSSSTAPTPSAAKAGATNYYVSQTSNGCESSRSLIMVIVNALPTASISTNTATTFCNGDSVTLTASSGTSFIWMNGTTQVGTNSTFNAKTSGNYMVTVTNSMGCQASSAITQVTVNSLPNAPTVSSMVTYCQNMTAVPLTAVGSGLLWYSTLTGGAGSSSAPTPSTTKAGATNYYVSQTSTGCESTRSLIMIIVNALPAAIINASGPTTFCDGDSIILTASTGTSYVWMNGSTQVGSNQTFNAKTSGSYSVQVTNSMGCQGLSAALNVTVNPLPNSPGVTNLINYCQGDVVNALTANGSNLNWYTTLTGGIASSIAPIPLTGKVGATNYYVSQTLNGCESSRSLIITIVNALPTVSISTGGMTTICSGDSVPLIASSASSYAWMDGTTEVGTSQIFNAKANGNYLVQVTNSMGCSASSPIVSITVTPSPNAPTVPTNMFTYCQNAVVPPISANGSGLKWYSTLTGGIGSTIVPTLSTLQTGATNYYVSQTVNGCESPRTLIILIVNPAPTASITLGGQTTLCNGDSVVLTASAASSYIWKNGTTEIGTNSNFNAKTSGKYTVQVTNSFGCSATSDTTVISECINTTASITPIPASFGASVRVYPNPYETDFAVSLPAGIFQVALYNAAGMEVEAGTYTNDAVLGSNLAPGIYMVRIEQNGNSEVRKVIKR